VRTIVPTQMKVAKIKWRARPNIHRSAKPIMQRLGMAGYA
jgi:hypothetical protein